jgi:hypothetical protein
MKYAEPRPLANPEKAARKLVDIANAVEAVQDGRIFIELINRPFLDQDGTPDQYRAALARAIALGWSIIPERTLTAAEIDAVISQTLAREALAAEHPAAPLAAHPRKRRELRHVVNELSSAAASDIGIFETCRMPLRTSAI